jgi:Asp-tRNA(Asn)/Glu-tRNA(Gln) amidotransferase A subunit family amidase
MVFSYNTTNTVWGRAQNPFDNSRSCGGSTGGEAGLVASKCIPIGLGADLGGTIRIPSDFNGLYGFKATSHRVPFSGTKALLTFNALSSPGGRIAPTIGPICRSMRDVVNFTRLMFHPEVNLKYDDYTPPMPFREELYYKAMQGKGMRVGICESLPTIPAC